MHIPSVPPVRLAKAAIQSAVSALIVLGAPHAALAANCVEQPNVQAAKDGQWYYRLDPMNHRKCWYLQQQPQSTESSTAGSNTAVQGSPSFGSFLLSLLPGRPSAVSNVPQQNAATVGTPSVPGTEPVAAKKSAPSSERRWVLRAKRSERPAQADQIKLRGEQKYLDSAQRDALFQEFLRWAAWHDQTQSFDGQ